MAVYQKNKIQEDVRTALDQNMNSDTLKINRRCGHSCT